MTGDAELSSPRPLVTGAPDMHTHQHSAVLLPAPSTWGAAAIQTSCKLAAVPCPAFRKNHRNLRDFGGNGASAVVKVSDAMQGNWQGEASVGAVAASEQLLQNETMSIQRRQVESASFLRSKKYPFRSGRNDVKPRPPTETDSAVAAVTNPGSLIS